VRLSVALVTRNRPSSLERTLRSLRAQDEQPFEVVVSDDSDDQQVAASREVALRHGARHVEGPHRGLYANRNAAALACAGTHVRTMDDDHEFPPGHVATCLQAVQRRPDTVWIIGECLPAAVTAPDPWVCPPQLHPRGHSVTPTPGTRIWAIADGASIYRREIFEHGLRFFEDFPFGASYLEWGSRLHWLGYDIRHLDETFVIHHYDPKQRSFHNLRNDQAASLFAALCHSFIYQRSIQNQAQTLGQLAVVAGQHGSLGMHAAADAWRAFRSLRRTAASMPRASH
jgi:glycosyltransferase involved in cell wall biosynthesis